VAEVFDDQTIGFLQGGCSIVVGTADDEGRPHAARAWGLTVTDPAAGHVRMLVEEGDETTLANLQPGRAVALTGSDVLTLRSVQLKGRVLRVEPAGEADRVTVRHFAEDFLRRIHETDRIEYEILWRWARLDVVACDLVVDEAFDQSPGPGAGAPAREWRP